MVKTFTAQSAIGYLANLLISLDVLQLVSGGEDLPGGSPVVVVEVVGDDGAAADKVVVLVEEEAGPGKLSRQSLAVLQTGGECWLTGPAELGARSDILRTSLGPGHVLDGGLGRDAVDTEH